jgi:DNA-directed RNA polymerase subunit F
MPRKVVSLKPITISEAADLLKQRYPNLTPLQQRVYEYANTFRKLPADKAQMLVEELQQRFGLEREEACQIVNICPRDINELRAVIAGYKRLISSILFSDQKLSEIVQTIESYAGEEAERISD